MDRFTKATPMHPADLGFGSLFCTVPDAVVVGDIRDGTVVLWNPGAQRMFGYAAAEIVGQSIERLIPSPVRQRHRTGLERYRTTRAGRIVGGHEAAEVPAITKSGKDLLVELTLAAVEVERSPTDYVAAIIRDVTERRRAQAREEALRAELELQRTKEAFLSTVAHEVRTPLTVIRGHVQLLRQRVESQDERLQRSLQIIERRIGQLTVLMRDIVEHAPLNGQGPPSSYAAMDYVELAQLVVTEFSLLYPDRHITVDAPPAAWIDGDPVRLHQVLSNLVDNGLKYGPADKPLRVSIEIAAEDVITRVCDGGPPLPPALRESIFERLVRGPSVSSAPGLGLGLHIARTIVEAHHGRIAVEDSDRSCFVVSIPVSRGNLGTPSC